MISVRFQGKPFNITVIQICALTTDAKEAEVDLFYVFFPSLLYLNTNISGTGELKWTGMGKFNSDDHYIYYCGQESLIRNGAALTISKKV